MHERAYAIRVDERRKVKRRGRGENKNAKWSVELSVAMLKDGKLTAAMCLVKLLGGIDRPDKARRTKKPCG